MTPVSSLHPCLRMYRGLNRGEIASITLGDGPKSRMVGTSSASIAMHDFHLHFLYGLYFRVIARSSFRPPPDLARDRYLRASLPLNGNGSDGKDNCATTKHFGREDRVSTIWKSRLWHFLK